MWLNLYGVLLFSWPVFVRWLRWLAIYQQKEYRVDRLMAYLMTSQGKSDLFRLLPTKHDFKRTSLKRPKLTLRVMFLAGLSSCLIGIIVWFAWQQTPFVFLLIMLGILLLIPDVIFLANLPFVLLFNLLVWTMVNLARHQVEQHQPTIVGITGSYGKTSTKLLLTHVLSQHSPIFATKRSFNTPFSFSRNILQRYRGEPIMVLEFAAYKPKEIGWLASYFQPHLAIITGLTEQHLAIFGSVENIIKAKAELVQALPDQAKVLLNAADPGTRQILKHAQTHSSRSYQAVEFSGKKNTVKISQLKLNKAGQLQFLLGKKPVKTKLVGKQYLSTVQAAVAAAKELGLTQTQIAQGLTSFQPPNSFVKLYQHPNKFWILDDGRTCNPAGFEAVITLTKELDQANRYQQKILVTAGIVDLGNESSQIHQQLAQRAKTVFDQVFFVGNSGKSEFKQQFKDSWIEEMAEIEKRLSCLKHKDLVVVEGKLPISLANKLKINQ